MALGDIYLHFASRCDAGRRDSFGVAGVALGDIYLHFAWQAWYLVTSTFTLRGRRVTYGTGPALVARLVLGVTLGARESFGVAGLALGDIYLHFAWHPWYLVTSTFTLRGRRGTYGTGPALVARLVLGVTLGAAALLAWQAWHLATSIFTLRGRRGTYGTGPALVARLVLGVTLGAATLLAWQVWHLATSIFTLRGRRQAWYFVTSTFTLRGSRGTYGTGPALVARLVLRVTLGAATLLAWQAWHLATSIFTLRGSRGTW